VGYLQSAESGYLWDDTLVIVSTDNGGTVTVGSSNFPLRGGKKTLWEGGVRATGFVTGGWLPDERRGEEMNALMHVTDWLPTLCAFAGIEPQGQLPLDGHDQSSNIMDGVVDVYAPREEILLNVNYYQVLQSDGVSSACYDDLCGAVRWKDYKLIIGSNDQMRFSDDTLCANSWCDLDSSESVSSHTIQCDADNDNYQFPDIDGDSCLYNGAACLYNVIEDPCEWREIGHEEPEIFTFLNQKMMDYNATQASSLYRGNPEIPILADPENNGGYWGPFVESAMDEAKVGKDTAFEHAVQMGHGNGKNTVVLIGTTLALAAAAVLLLGIAAIFRSYRSQKGYKRIVDGESMDSLLHAIS